jgi:hypothetical protein
MEDMRRIFIHSEISYGKEKFVNPAIRENRRRSAYTGMPIDERYHRAVHRE